MDDVRRDTVNTPVERGRMTHHTPPRFRTRIALALGALLPAIIALVGAPSSADAQCAPGSIFCAELRIGGGQAPPPPPPAPPEVVVVPAPPPPAPPVVYVQPAPPPPPRVVYVQPPPPPRVVYVQPPQRQYVVTRPIGRGRIGLNGFLGGMGGDVSMGGIGGALRLRPTPNWALDLGMGVYAGSDYEDNDRVEVPFTADALFFVNPQSRFQFYVVGGLGFSYARVEGAGCFDRYRYDYACDATAHDYGYFGGQVGAGLELRLSQHFALNGDLRGFLRGRIDTNDPEPEFTHEDGRTTNTSGGVYGRLGATFYF